MVWIHGGGFITGSGNSNDGSLLSTNGKVIVVTANYRLSTLGFFSTQSDVAPGNYGLWDQIAALQWVKDNIAEFGGDVSRITVMGQSAGAASVSHLALSSAAKGLFQRVILASGSSASYFGATRYQAVTSKRLANHFNCSTTSDEEAVNCLREKSAFSLNILGLAYPPLADLYFCTNIPNVDGELVSGRPIDSMAAGLNADYDLLTGLTKHDCADFALPFTGSKLLVNVLLNFIFNVYENRDELVPLVYERYPDLNSDDLDTRQRVLVKLGTDLIFGARALKEAELHQKTSNRSTYLYEFQHQYSSTSPPWLEGVHSEDLRFIFGQDSFEGPDAELSRYIQSYYTNFAYTGNPNSGPHSVPVDWPQFDPSTNKRLIQSPEPFVENIPQELVGDLEWANDLYDLVVPRLDNDGGDETLSPESLDLWNMIMKEINLQKPQQIEDSNLRRMYNGGNTA